jgi:hypothetical protein
VTPLFLFPLLLLRLRLCLCRPLSAYRPPIRALRTVSWPTADGELAGCAAAAGRAEMVPAREAVQDGTAT